MTPTKKVDTAIFTKIETMRRELNMTRRGLVRELLTAAIRSHPGGDPEFLRPWPLHGDIEKLKKGDGT